MAKTKRPNFYAGEILRMLHAFARDFGFTGAEFHGTCEMATIDGKRGIYGGVEYACKHRNVSRLQVLLTGADLFLVTVWRHETEKTNVVDFMTGETIYKVVSQGEAVAIDRVFAPDLVAVVAFLFGMGPRPEEGKGGSWNVDVKPVKGS